MRSPLSRHLQLGSLLNRFQTQTTTGSGATGSSKSPLCALRVQHQHLARSSVPSSRPSATHTHTHFSLSHTVLPAAKPDESLLEMRDAWANGLDVMKTFTTLMTSPGMKVREQQETLPLPRSPGGGGGARRMHVQSVSVWPTRPPSADHPTPLQPAPKPPHHRWCRRT